MILTVSVRELRMCGIVGVFRPGYEALAPEAVAAMRDVMAHRGPDGAGLWQSDDRACVLGHRRLAIVDLSEAASQPMLSPDGALAIVFNGEIYNHLEVRRDLEALGYHDWRTDHSDTEALLKAWQAWGPDCLERLRGMFAFALYDARDRTRPRLHLVRDRMGKKPLYIARTARGEWVFGSEIKALMAHPDITAEMDVTAFLHYLTFVVAPAPLTLFRGVFKLPAAHRVTIDADGSARSERYFALTPSRAATLRESDLSFAEAAAELTRLMRQAVRRRMVSDVPFGVLLSGGVDSGLITALMAEEMDRPVTTFSIGYRDDTSLNEFDHARRVAARWATDHHEIRIGSADVLDCLEDLVHAQDEPIADNVCIPLWFIAKLVRDSGTTVVQVGEGADEHFLGYWWCEHYREKDLSVYQPARRSAQRPLWRRLRPSGGRSRRDDGEDAEIRARARHGEELFWGGAVCFRGALRDRLAPVGRGLGPPPDCPVEGLMPDALAATDSGAVVAAHTQALGALAEPAVLQKISFLESRMRLPEHLLMRIDKMTMAHSVEARAPFLDDDVVRFALRLPLSYKLEKKLGKRVVKAAAEPFVDHDLLYRRKQGFGAPVETWLTDQAFARRMSALFRRSRLVKDGILDGEMADGLLSEQMAGRGGHGFHLWTLINAMLWHEKWIGG